MKNVDFKPTADEKLIDVDGGGVIGFSYVEGSLLMIGCWLSGNISRTRHLECAIAQRFAAMTLSREICDAKRTTLMTLKLQMDVL